MRRVLAIQSGVAAGLWVLGALCVAAEVRQPGFWCDRIGSLKGRTAQSGDRVSDPIAQIQSGQQTSRDQQSPEPALQSNEIAEERQAAQLPAAKPDTQTQASHTRLIVISIPDRRLALLEDGQAVKVYVVAVGAKHSPSPEGEYTVINHSVNPTYRHKEKKIDPGKDNPLGSRWMGLSLKGYGIHGTNVQSSIGKASSHGCFRMKKKDVEQLYERVKVGDPVSIRGQRDELTAQLFTPAPVTNVSSVTTAAAGTASQKDAELASTALYASAGGGGQ